MSLEMGYCNGIENYSRHMDGRARTTTDTLLDFFPEDALFVLDESHIKCPKFEECIMGRARKEQLIRNGFRIAKCARIIVRYDLKSSKKKFRRLFIFQ